MMFDFWPAIPDLFKMERKTNWIVPKNEQVEGLFFIEALQQIDFQ
jgi:hypothetical protein